MQERDGNCPYGARSTDDGDIGDDDDSGVACVSDEDCPMFEEIMFTAADPAACPSCNSHGYCGYLDLKTEQPLLSCKEGDVSCIALCVCDGGYNGKSCLFSDEEINKRREVRDDMIASFRELLSAEDPSVDTVEAWIFFLSALVQNPDELSSNAVATVGNMTSLVLKAAGEVGMGYEKVLALFDIADVVVELRDLVTVSNDTDSVLKAPFALQQDEEADDDGAYDAISSSQIMGDLIGRDMVVGQSEVSAIKSSYRMGARATAVDDGASANFSVPVTAMEKSNNSRVLAQSVPCCLPPTAAVERRETSRCQFLRPMQRCSALGTCPQRTRT